MHTSGVREAVGEALLLDPRCSSLAVSAHWYMERKSAFWKAIEVFGVPKSSIHGRHGPEPEPHFLSHDVAWWKTTIAGGVEARAALSQEDKGRYDAYKLIRLMTPFSRPSGALL